MAEPIIYHFVADGHGEVVTAIKSITSAALESRRALEDAGRASTSFLGRGAGRGGPYRSPPLLGAGGGGEPPEVKAAKKTAERIVSLQEKAAERVTILTQRAEEKRAGLVRTSTAAIIREIDREDRAREAAAKKAERAAQRARDRFLRDPMSAVPGLLRSGVRAIAGLGMSAFHTGASLVGGAVRESMETQDIANRVSINARMPGQQAVDPTQLRKEFERAAVATPGQSAADIGRATQQYVDLTGDLDTARNSMSTFATVASATGAKVEDVATAAASIGKQFDVKKVEDMQRVFAGLAFQGKGGAMTLKDIAAQFQRLAAAGAAFGLGKGPEAVAKLGGLLQIARSATGNPRQAATAVENIFRNLTAKAGKAGVKLYDKAGSQRDVNEVLAETIAHVGGTDAGAKKAALSKMFGAQGVRGVNPLIATATEAMAGKHGKDAERAAYDAVLAKLHEMASISADWSEVQKDAAQAQQSASAQLTAAWETLKAAAGERLAPKLAELATRLAGDGKALDLFVTAVGLAADTLEALAAKLQQLGLISGGSSEEKSAAAGKAAADTRQKLAAMGPYDKLSPEKQSEFRGLATKYNMQRQIAADEGYRASLVKVAGENAAGPESAATAYKMLGGTGAHTGAKVLDAIVGGFMGPVAGLLGIGPDVKKSDAVHGLLGENLEQRSVRNAAERRGESVDGGVSPQVKHNLSDLAEAAQKAKAALDAVGKAGGTVKGEPLREAHR